MAFPLLNTFKWGALVLLAAFIFASYGLFSLQEISLTNIYMYLAPKIGAAILLALAGKALIEITSPIIMRLIKRSEVKESVERAWKWIIWCAVLFTTVAVFIGDASTIVITFSLVLLGVAFAFRKPLLSIVGWLNITVRGVYSIGDIIKSDWFMGEVTDINMFSTTIWDYRAGERGQTGIFISVPNSLVFEHPLAVLQRGKHHIWDEISISLPLRSDYNKARNALLKACDDVIGAKKMGENAKEQREMLKGYGLFSNVPSEPIVYTFLNGDRIELRLRYLVDFTQRYEVKDEISEHALHEISKSGIKLKPQ